MLEIDPNAYAVASSGYADGDVLRNPFQYGFKAVLAKPYTMMQLQDLAVRTFNVLRNKKAP